MKRRRVTAVEGDELEAQEEDVKHFVCIQCELSKQTKQKKNENEINCWL